ncbi:MAG: cell division protein FtsQ/DivIB [Rickettsiales bacterium]|nr:cell division protein FtsQ/DivIB [Rickettsiales bacterium]
MAKATQRQRTSRQASRTKAARKRVAQARRWTMAVCMFLGMVLLVGGSWKIYSLDLVARAGMAFGESVDSLMASSGFRLNQIEVTGRDKTDVALIKNAIGMVQGHSIFSASLSDIRTQLEAISTVRHATVERRLPDRLFVQLQERVPVAVWQNNQILRVVDADGKVLEKEQPEAYKHLMVVVGVDAPKHLPELFHLLNDQHSLVADVTSAVRVGGRRWDLRLKNGVKVLLPEEDPSQALQKLAQWKQEKKIMEKAISAIDFRLKERVFIRLTPEESPKKAGGPAQEV